MFGYHVPAKAITVYNEKHNLMLPKQQAVINSNSAVESIPSDLIILFENFETAVAFALYDDKDLKNETREYFPIYEFLVKDLNKIERVSLDETGKVVEKGGIFGAWRTEYSNLVTIRATLSYVRNDIPDFVFNVKASTKLSNENKNLLSLVLRLVTTFCLNLLTIWNNKQKNSNLVKETEILSQQIKALQTTLTTYHDDDPMMKTAVSGSDISFQETSICYRQDVLARKKKTLSQFVAANEQKMTSKSDGYNKVKKK